MRHYIFLLGGQDLEMKTIRELLLAAGYTANQDFYDLKLGWSNAHLSAYRAYYQPGDRTYVGIELKADLHLPAGVTYREIDHHNEASGRPASLEQVAALLEIPLNREQQLIAANDRAYIPGMVELGATEEEIERIRAKRLFGFFLVGSNWSFCALSASIFLKIARYFSKNFLARPQKSCV